MSVLNSTAAFTATFGERIGTWFRNTAENRVKRDLYRQTVRELSALSNRDLADLGIARSDISRVALKHAQLA